MITDIFKYYVANIMIWFFTSIAEITHIALSDKPPLLKSKRIKVSKKPKRVNYGEFLSHETSQK